MTKNILILITGMPATGKTTLGVSLSAKYHLPFISKDALKDRMFDTLGSNDKEWSLKVSAASHRIMDYIVDEEFNAGHSIILESNFKPHIDSERFRRIQEKYECDIIQIVCWAEGEVIFKRFTDRIGTSARHEGHVEIPLEQIKEDFISANGKDEPLDIDGVTLELDTTNLDAVDYKEIYNAIENSIRGGRKD